MGSFSLFIGRRFLTTLTAGLLAVASCPATAWETAHGTPDNRGFVDVTTRPAANPRIVEGVGPFAMGNSPVIGPNGNVYFGNGDGTLVALRSDGGYLWSRKVAQNQAIIAQPAIGSDGTIYVIGIDNQPGQYDNSYRVRFASYLHRFNSSGGYLGYAPLPEHNGFGTAGGAPNIWRHNGQEAVMVTAFYKHPVIGGGIDLRLIAFAPNGGVLADKVVNTITPTTTGGGPMPIITCLVIFPCMIFDITTRLDTDAGFAPFPTTSIFTNPNGGTPFILVSDFFKTIVGVTFSDGQITDRIRAYDVDRLLRSSPMTLPNGLTMISYESVSRDHNGTESSGFDGGVLFTGPNMTKVPAIGMNTGVLPTPTRLADGRVVVPVNGLLNVVQNNKKVQSIRMPAASVSPAAASRNHVFVATKTALITYDAQTFEEVGRQNWTNGGYSRPVIGPKGDVYAIANGRLYVFAASTMASSGPTMPGFPATGGGITGGGVYQDAGIPVVTPAPAPTQQNKTYKPPVTAANNRLFACEELDGDDCGKGDHREISKAFCMKQGFTKAADFDVDTEKVRAETLDGRFCSKSKCKVFEEISCSQ